MKIHEDYRGTHQIIRRAGVRPPQISTTVSARWRAPVATIHNSFRALARIRRIYLPPFQRTGAHQSQKHEQPRDASLSFPKVSQNGLGVTFDHRSPRIMYKSIEEFDKTERCKSNPIIYTLMRKPRASNSVKRSRDYCVLTHSRFNVRPPISPNHV